MLYMSQVKHYIYAITNSVNGKLYIGQSIDPLDRWSTHKSHALKGYDSSPFLYRAIRKYGPDVFTFEVIASYDDQETANRAETFFIAIKMSDDPSTGYNLDWGGKAHLSNPISRRKLSESQKRRYRLDPMLATQKSIQHRQWWADMTEDERKAQVAKTTSNIPRYKGCEAPWSKLTDDDVRDIRKGLSAGRSLRSIAKEFGVAHSTIHAIKSGKRWGHIA